MAVERLTLTDFRSYATLDLPAAPGFNVLVGPNGAGKTNILEALSLLAPGRGLRGVPLSEMARTGGAGGFTVSAIAGGTTIGTGTRADASDRRLVRITGAAASATALAEHLSLVWLTPAQDRLFNDSAGTRRRFLDRLVIALEPAHARHVTRYEAAMRERNRLLAEEAADAAWLAGLEAAMAEHGVAVADARQRLIDGLSMQSEAAAGFPRYRLELTGDQMTELPQRLAAGRHRDSQTGRASHGPHTQDLRVSYADKDRPAASSSTGEQKALLIGLVLAHAELVAARTGHAPILLLDEVAAHLDAGRRAALFERLAGRGQVWLTGTDRTSFDGLPENALLIVDGGEVHRT